MKYEFHLVYRIVLKQMADLMRFSLLISAVIILTKKGDVCLVKKIVNSSVRRFEDIVNL